jgi:predicted enzyme related to lactoylglutathione lyase
VANLLARFLIGAQDRAKAARFYSQLFDWKIEEHGDSHRITTGGKLPGSIVNADEGFASFFVQVDDIEASLKRVEELGGEVVAPPSQKGNGRYAVFSDPDGTWIGLFERTKDSDE